MADIIDGKIEYRYVFGTVEECDIEGRVEEPVLSYIKENGLFYKVIDDAVDWMRDWIDYESDPFWWAIEDALKKNVGKEKLAELEEEA